jgi:hypothetical protein
MVPYSAEPDLRHESRLLTLPKVNYLRRAVESQLGDRILAIVCLAGRLWNESAN